MMYSSTIVVLSDGITLAASSIVFCVDEDLRFYSSLILASTVQYKA